MYSIRKPYRSIRIWIAIASLFAFASCERALTKSDYVSARVTETCKGRSGTALQMCRLAVITQFKDVPFEEMKRRYPKPIPKQRPACSFSR